MLTDFEYLYKSIIKFHFKGKGIMCLRFLNNQRNELLVVFFRKRGIRVKSLDNKSI